MLRYTLTTLALTLLIRDIPILFVICSFFPLLQGSDDEDMKAPLPPDNPMPPPLPPTPDQVIIRKDYDPKGAISVCEVYTVQIIYTTCI